MTHSKLVPLSCSWMRVPWAKPYKGSIETLTAFVRDAEHEMLSVATALQSHVDLLQREQEGNLVSTKRFAVLNHVIARLVSDATILASVSELTRIPREQTKQNVARLMREIISETKSEFIASHVSLSCEIKSDVSLVGSTGALKMMFKETVLALLLECENLETIRVSGKADKKNLSVSFDTGTKNKSCKFEPWRLGKLRLVPINGETITLAAIDAVARLHQGQLSVKSLPNQRREYRLNFTG